MTALAEYERLECEGRYRPSPGAPPQSVVVKFGDASLTVLTFADEPITHWPLASLAFAPTPEGMTLRPDPAASDGLDITDAAMMTAIRTVCAGRGAVQARPRRRLGRWLVAAAVVGVLAAGGWALLPVGVEVLARRLPTSAEAMLGSATVRAYADTSLCETAAGTRGLAALARRLTPAGHAPVRLWVASVAAEAPRAVAAGGGQVLLDRSLVSGARDARALAGPVAEALAAALEAERTVSAVRGAGIAGLPALLAGRMDSPRLVAAAVAGLRETRTADPARAAALLDAMPLPPDRTPLVTAQDWAAIRRICGP